MRRWCIMQKFFRSIVVAFIWFITGCNDNVAITENSNDSSVFINTTSYTNVTEDNSVDSTGFDETISHNEGRNNIITGLANDILEIPGDLVIANGLNSCFFSNFTYVMKSYPDFYSNLTEPEMFNEDGIYVGNENTESILYTKVMVGDIINDYVVKTASYECSVFHDDIGNNITSPQLSSLVLSGNITLHGILIRINNEAIGKALIFYPYTQSLKDLQLPILHTEKIYSPDLHTYGESIPIIIDDNLNLSFSGNYVEAVLTFSTIEQKWNYGNGSGWSPCFSEVIDYTLLLG